MTATQGQQNQMQNQTMQKPKMPMMAGGGNTLKWSRTKPVIWFRSTPQTEKAKAKYSRLTFPSFHLLLN